MKLCLKYLILGFMGIILADQPVSSASAYQGAMPAVGIPLEWQKVNLEDQIQQKLVKAISPGLSEKYFVISVAISLKPRQEKVERAPANQDSERGDRISLSKIDVDAPIFQDETIQREQEREEINLFKHIQKTAITVIFDQSVTDAKVEVVKKIITSLVGSLGEAAPEVTVEKADLISTAPPEPEAPWNAKRWVMELKTPVTLLLVTLVFFVMILFVFSGYKRLESRRISVIEAQNAREEAAAQAKSEAAEAMSSGLSVANKEVELKSAEVFQLEGAQRGFDRFRVLMQQAPEQASSLVRQWVKAPVQGAAQALAILPQILSTEELLTIFSHLSLEDRREWKKMLSTPLDQAGTARAEQFIASQIVECLLMPAPSMEDELKEMISQLTLSECVEMASTDPDLGALLLNILPTAQVARMLAILPAQESAAVTVASLKFTAEEVQAKSNKLKAAIQKVQGKAKNTSSPFMERAAELLTEVGPEKEGAIFSAIAESGEYQLLQETAQRYFPAELMLKLPGDLLKACLDRLPLTRRAELIVSRDEGDRSTLLNAIGEIGSKLRDMIDVEVSEVSNDPARLRKVSKSKDAIWREFVETSRALIRSNEAAADRAESVLDRWLEERTEGKIGGAIDQQNVA